MTGNVTRTRPPRHAGPPSATFRSAMSRFPTGVALLTLGSAETLQAMTVNSVVSVSLEPLLILVSVGASSRMRCHMDPGAGFAVHVLSATQADVAALFACRNRPTGRAAARRLAAVPSTAGNVVVPGTVATFECVPYARHGAGDHVLYLGRVVALRVAADDPAPLLFHRSRYGAPG